MIKDGPYSSRIGTCVELNDQEQTIVKMIAQQRSENNREHGITNAKIGSSQNSRDVDLEGFGAEVAFCKLFNLFPDFTVSTRSSQKGQDKGDATLHHPYGWVVDVKQTNSGSKLVAAPWKGCDVVDLFALMVGKLPSYTFMGFMTSKELLTKERIGTLGRGPTHIARLHELKELPQVVYKQAKC